MKLSEFRADGNGWRSKRKQHASPVSLSERISRVGLTPIRLFLWKVFGCEQHLLQAFASLDPHYCGSKERRGCCWRSSVRRHNHGGNVMSADRSEPREMPGGTCGGTLATGHISQRATVRSHGESPARRSRTERGGPASG